MTIPLDEPSAFQLARDCLASLVDLDMKYPGERSFKSILIQLRLIESVSSFDEISSTDRHRFNFGTLAMRFVYEFDEELAGKIADLKTYIERRYGEESE
ncbi:hypothetical protein [Telmatospirillum sp.]|uniref:hypothetical protein n=1 Tax=Telmatospirillum sp. TaxID=2079197 RepID=UPI002848B983|nr:hypothetical protein [Telmatospirillum sp.]MDR3437501.1 hypothetical protein [Telmatospirillum sp.]